jgi:tetratricopeptide (TPR) repeat protein
MAASRDQLLQAAEKSLSKGKLDQALKDYLRVLDDNPKDIPTLNKVGDLYVRMNRPSDSIPFYTRIADFYSRDGFFLKAIAIYKKINKIDPARLDVYERLADLYHKQGLAQDARSQYQVLADHYLKNNKSDEAIAAFKKMASVDPNDLKIHVRLADLYRTNRQIDQAVMQYGLIGSMLLRRGAHDEAAAVFQKALELSPNDAEIQRNLVRSLIAQRNPQAAIAILKAVPRTADSLALLAEAQHELGERGDAIHSAEQAIALDAKHEEGRVLLSRFRLAEGRADAAVAAIMPVLDAAMASKEFNRAAALLEPIIEAHPTHRSALQRMAQVRESQGETAAAVALWLKHAREDEARGDTHSAIESYRRVVSLNPGDTEASSRLSALIPSLPADVTSTAPASIDSNEVVVEIEEPITPPPVAASAPRPVPPVSTASAEEQEIESLVVEVEVFAKYGLVDKAIERLRALTRRRPDLLRARERLVDLMAESQNPALRQEAESLAEIYREKGEAQKAQTLLARLAESTREEPPPEPESVLPPPAAQDIHFEEFDIEPAPSLEEPPAPAVDAGNETIRFSAADISPTAPPSTASSPRRPTPLEGIAPVESDFVSYEELGSLLDDEMQKAGEAAAAPAPPPTSAPLVDDQNLFADEQQFFNLAEELERELADDAQQPAAPAMAGPEGGEASLEEIFREFKKGVEQQLSAEDYETHFNLGIAYKEMGLIDEAIGEFQLASKDPGRVVECCSMLGLCFLEKGMPQLAVKWYRKGMEAPNIKENESVGLLYDLACVYQSIGETDLAYKTFLEVYGLNTNYRDIVSRVRELEAVKKG